jgi:hypothetical protein
MFVIPLQESLVRGFAIRVGLSATSHGEGQIQNRTGIIFFQRASALTFAAAVAATGVRMLEPGH